jgi:hypothetical protein
LCQDAHRLSERPAEALASSVENPQRLSVTNEFPDYYTRLERMEEGAKREHGAA